MAARGPILTVIKRRTETVSMPSTRIGSTEMPRPALLTPLLWAVVVAVSVGGCGTGEPTDTAGGPAAASDRDPQHTDEQEVPDVASCEALIDGGWSAPAGDPAFSYDPETGLVDVTFGPEETFRLDLLKDPFCDRLPDIGALLSRVSSDYELMRVQECTQGPGKVTS